MVRRRRLLAHWLLATLFAGAFAAADRAVAQSADNDFGLLSPQPQTDPSNPPSFQQPGSLSQGTRLRFLPSYRVAPAQGAGTTGFNSTNLPRGLPRNGATSSGQTVSGSSQTPSTQARAQPGQARPASGTAASSATGGINAQPDYTGYRRPLRKGAPADATAMLGAFNPYAVPTRRVPREQNPFDPLGWRAGAFLVLPSVEFDGGYDSNPARTQNGKGSSFFTVAPEVSVRSDWERHSLTADLRGTYSDYRSEPLANRPTFDGKVDGRIDVTRDSSIDLEARSSVGTDNPGSPNIQADLTRYPVFTTFGASAGATQRFNRLQVSAKASVDRTSYQDSHFTDGSIQNNDDLNFNQYGVQLRTGYEVSPGVTPFVEASLDTRKHDEAIDRSGFHRDSQGTTIRGGASFDLPQRLKGEIAVGYTMRHYQDPTLEDLKGLIFDASLVWTASALTSVTLTGTSAANELILPGQSGYLSRDAGVQIDHALREWLVITGKAGIGFDDYQSLGRRDRRYQISAGFIYKATRTVQIKGEVRRQWLTSSAPGNDYTANVVMLGVRLAR